MTVIIRRCIYEEPDPKTYRGFELERKGPHPGPVFFSDNPTVDYLAALFVAHFFTNEGKAGVVMGASSVDHFAMDGGIVEFENPSDDDVEKAKAWAHRWVKKADLLVPCCESPSFLRHEAVECSYQACLIDGELEADRATRELGDDLPDGEWSCENCGKRVNSLGLVRAQVE